MAEEQRSPGVTSDMDRRTRGVQALGHPMVSGGLIGAIGGAAFVFSGIAALESEHTRILAPLAVVLVAYTFASVLLPRRTLPALPEPQPWAKRVYQVSVIVMLALLPVTWLASRALGAPSAQIALVAAVVGAHFLPFASAFKSPVFTWIGGSMLLLGIAGAVLAATGTPAGGPACATAAGAAMLAIIAGQATASARSARVG